MSEPDCFDKRYCQHSGRSRVVIGRRAPQPLRHASDSICSSSASSAVLDRAEVGHDKVRFFLCRERVLVQEGQMPERGRE